MENRKVIQFPEFINKLEITLEFTQKALIWADSAGNLLILIDNYKKRYICIQLLLSLIKLRIVNSHEYYKKNLT